MWIHKRCKQPVVEVFALSLYQYRNQVGHIVEGALRPIASLEFHDHDTVWDPTGASFCLTCEEDVPDEDLEELT